MKKILLAILFLFYLLPCSGFIEKDLKKLTTQNGMPDNMIYCIYRDKNQFMWFATDQGVSRYDGTTLRSFALQSKNQVANNIMGSESDLLWITGGGELHCFNLDGERFLDVKNSDLITNAKSSTVKVYKDSLAWIVGANTLSTLHIRWDKERDRIVLSRAIEYPNFLAHNEKITTSAIDSLGNLYFATTNDNVYIKELHSAKFEKHHLKIRKSAKNPSARLSRINVIEGSLWFSTSGAGVVRYFLDTHAYHQFDDTGRNAMNSEPLAHTTTSQVAMKESGQYIVVTWNGYATITYDEQTRRPIAIKNYSNIYSDTHRSVESRFRSVYIDPDQILWLGTYGGGVLISNLNNQFYEQTHFNSSNEIVAIELDALRYVWISTYHKGVLRSTKPFDVKEQLTFTVKHPNMENGVARNMMSLAVDGRDLIWAGAVNSTLVAFDAAGSYREFRVKVDNRADFNGALTSVYFAKAKAEEVMWIGTDMGLLKLYDRQNYRAQLIESTANLRVSQITSDPSGTLWLSTTNGAYRFDPRSHELKGYAPEMVVHSVLAPSADSVYIGTNKGLITIEKGKQTHLYTTKDGLCNNFVACLVQGPRGEIWLGSNSGISRFSRSRKIFYNHYIQGNNRSCARSSDGALIWGNNKSLTYFSPSTLESFYQRISVQEVRVTAIEVAGRMVRVQDTINGQVVLKRSLVNTNKITLNSDNNNFSLQVSNLLFNIDNQIYQYRLLPLQNNWITIRHGERISYAGLPAANYTFQVRSLSTQIDKARITELEIEIQAHWFNSWWFRTLCVILMMSVIAILIVRIKSRYRHQIYLSELKNELNAKHVELDKERQINQERVSFFTYASHELRTPLTMVLSPVQQLLASDNLTDEIKRKLSLIERNASVLLELVGNLLFIQKIDAKMVELNINKANVVNLVEQVVDSFAPLCSANSVEITVKSNIAKNQAYLYVDEQKINSMINNLISNSIKYRRSGVKSIVEITIDEQQREQIGYVVISIADNGQGISLEAQKTIFDSFATDHNAKEILNISGIRSTEQIGVGLFIVNNIVQMHHGKIELTSTPGEGTTFTILIPVDNYHFAQSSADNIRIVTPVEDELCQINPVSQTILVVEDNPDILDYICSLFANSYRMLRATDGEQGVQMAIKEMPDIILQDIMLPGISGIECCRILSQNTDTSHIPIIVLSAKSDEYSVVDGLSNGADDYLVKPFNPQILKAKVESLLRSRTMLKQIYAKSLKLDSGESPKQASSDNFMQRVINIIEANLTNPLFGVEMLAQELSISPSTLRRNIKAYTAQSVAETIRNVRLTKAASLLLEQYYRIGEVAEMVGYNDISSFRTHFTKKFGMPPSKFHNS